MEVVGHRWNYARRLNRQSRKRASVLSHPNRLVITLFSGRGRAKTITMGSNLDYLHRGSTPADRVSKLLCGKRVSYLDFAVGAEPVYRQPSRRARLLRAADRRSEERRV